ncbi:MAG TPA: DNA (cytosine-5-)-methyltransferase [Agrobacterium sp.]|uniref:DNA cytosine methyltransferase n=1 Tax=Brevibacterium casei TaxID=33889 RepID=UPI000EC5AEEA|nr:DNA cytosine methyltransferase [Brevibacterium casei]MDH5150350.1 DNA cytosine methyltransferase [Brevibacterium casei]HCD85823.1 DNA (cytosine-5-)-methyltransferase [Agrobacterium sp.]
MTETQLLTAREASEWLGVSPSVITKLSNAGTLNYATVGARKVYKPEDLDSFLHSSELTRPPLDKVRSKVDIPEITAVSFFSGAGGLDRGLEEAGIESLLYCENNRECRMTLMRNRPNAGLLGDIKEVTADKVWEYSAIEPSRGIDVMFGGPPCQAFSTAGARRAFDDKRGNIFLKFLDIANDLSPKYLVIENVRGLLSTPFPLSPGKDPVRGGALSLILRKLESMKYGYTFELYNSANFGSAQTRERVILIAKRDGTRPPYLEPTHSNDPKWKLPKWRTFNDATANLKDVEHHYKQFPNRRLKYFELLKAGEYWTSLPAEQQAEAMGKAYGLSGGRTGFYRRIDGNRPSPTLVTSPTMPATDLCHPTELRPLSIEEYKAIQGFPTDWWIAGSITEKYKQIGNAVPVSLGVAIGNTLVADIRGTTENDSTWAGFSYSRYAKTSDKTWVNPSA